MRNFTPAIAVALLFADTPPALAADIGVMSRPHVRVRIYETADLQPETRVIALATAASILDAAGLDVTWLLCGAVPGAGALNPCHASMCPAELAVRLVAAPAVSAARDAAVGGEGHPGVALGYSLIDREARTGALATIYVDRVERLAAAFGADHARLIGRTLAHELGHLLLGTTAHSGSGLMKAIWPREVLERDQAQDWWFTDVDARAIRNRAQRHSSRQLAARLTRER